MKRREFITLLGGVAAAWPLVGRAQRPAVPVIGFLHSAEGSYFAPYVAAFAQGLKENGYSEGQNLTIEYRSAEGHYERLPALVADLIDRHPELIVAAGGTDPAKAAKAATTSIPIVFVTAADPIQLGLVASLNRPSLGSVCLPPLSAVRSSKYYANWCRRRPFSPLSSIRAIPVPSHSQTNFKRRRGNSACAWSCSLPTQRRKSILSSRP